MNILIEALFHNWMEAMMATKRSRIIASKMKKLLMEKEEEYTIQH
jgi:hypothetical protein